MSGRGLTGLANVGNSCYLNACVQILSHTHELSKFLDDDQYKQRLRQTSDSVLLVEWDKLRRLMWSEDCTIAPWGFVNSVKKISIMKGMSLFSGFQQNDVSEFLGFLLDAFHMALARSVEMSVKGKVKNDRDRMAKECYSMMKRMYEKEYSELLTMFYGISVSQVISKDGKEVLGITPEPFSTITLDIPAKANPSIFDCMENYCKGEILEGENAYYDERTNSKVTAMRRLSFWSLPPVLIIGLKRFLYSPTHRKIHTVVSTPLTNVDFSKYMTGYSKNKGTYELYGVCNHSGSVLGGHYTAYAKLKDQSWYSFNDTETVPIKEDRVITGSAYYLFYRKIK